MKYYFECGEVQGESEGRSVGVAFRKLMRRFKKSELSILLRFRSQRKLKWAYQDPIALLKEK